MAFELVGRGTQTTAFAARLAARPAGKRLIESMDAGG